jgi:hypothetical protein
MTNLGDNTGAETLALRQPLSEKDGEVLTLQGQQQAHKQKPQRQALQNSDVNLTSFRDF